jgi:molecular chaperone GrpE
MHMDAEDNRDAVQTETPDIERLRDELRQKSEMYMRALADFDNFRKRVDRERAAAVKRGKREVILVFLHALDGFDRALEHAMDDSAPIANGVRSIYRELIRQLEAQGVQRFGSRGEVFDPRLHEAVASVESDELEPGTIVGELQAGYRWDDEVLRPARVTVAR